MRRATWLVTIRWDHVLLWVSVMASAMLVGDTAMALATQGISANPSDWLEYRTLGALLFVIASWTVERQLTMRENRKERGEYRESLAAALKELATEQNGIRDEVRSLRNVVLGVRLEQ